MWKCAWEQATRDLMWVSCSIAFRGELREVPVESLQMFCVLGRRYGKKYQFNPNAKYAKWTNACGVSCWSCFFCLRHKELRYFLIIFSGFQRKIQIIVLMSNFSKSKNCLPVIIASWCIIISLLQKFFNVIAFGINLDFPFFYLNTCDVKTY